MKQHTHIYKKWLNRAVFGTPINRKTTSNNMAENSYFGRFAFSEFCGSVDIVNGAVINPMTIKNIKLILGGINYDS